MAQKIAGTVGRGGRNLAADVRLVQTQLRAHGFPPGPADGICGPRTIAAIVGFQQSFLRHPDGVIAPGGPTWRRLSALPNGTAPNGLPPRLAGEPSLVLVPRPPEGTVNIGLRAVSNRLMLELFGNPRESYGQDCQGVTNQGLSRNMVTGQAGPVRVTGLAPAVESLRAVFRDVQTAFPDLYPFIGTAGMLCCRFQRGSTRAISNHSWGTAIDLKLHGVLDARGDNRVQFGLTLIAPIFNRHGWYWGAAFQTEDAMHFEGSQKLVTRWRAALS
ncbi:M15 family metallopeptidase [Falsiroseomonas sp.]|uniref:M15 family metallopeptidase n=1 Tax=Falsiroseomonas sp. TaxID=2870721 RepID=UPI003563D88A